MKKFLTLAAASSMALMMVGTALADTMSSSSSSSAASSTSSTSSSSAMSSSSTSAKWTFVPPKGSGSNCEDMRGMAKLRCTSGAMKNALGSVQNRMIGNPYAGNMVKNMERKIMKTEEKIMKRGEKIEGKMAEMLRKISKRNIKETERARQRANKPLFKDIYNVKTLGDYVKPSSSSSSAKSSSSASSTSSSSSH